MNSFLALFAVMMLGIGQLLTRNILSASSKSLFVIPIIMAFYFCSGIIWIKLLKVGDNLAMLYGVLILGSFLSILVGNQILISKKFIIYTKDVIAIIFISTGCYLLKWIKINIILKIEVWLILFWTWEMFCRVSLIILFFTI